MNQDVVERVVSTANSEEERVKRLKELFSLIKNSTSINVVCEFLKDKNLTFSAGSWEELYNKRIIKHYEEGKISLDELDGLLERTEGYGHQHIFLFAVKKLSCQNLEKYLDADHVKIGLSQITDAKLNISPLYLDLPDKPKIVDARLTQNTPKIIDETLLTLKEIEKRSVHELILSKHVSRNTQYIKKYNIVHKRAINVARLWGNGLLEIRITSKDNSVKYDTELKGFLHRISPIFKIADFEPISLINLKSNLWNERSKLANLVRFSSYSLADEEGVCLKANVLSDNDDLAENEKLGKSFEEFNSSTTLCTDSNIFIKYPLADGKFKEIHVLLSGAINEFAVTSAVNREEYDYVLGKILEHN